MDMLVERQYSKSLSLNHDDGLHADTQELGQQAVGAVAIGVCEADRIAISYTSVWAVQEAGGCMMIAFHETVCGKD